MTAYLNLGSNIGDRKAHIERAVALISQAYPQAALRRAAYTESEPWGYSSANAYVNLGIALDGIDGVAPMQLLRTLQRIERTISPMPHRTAEGEYADREIDIDIVAIDGVSLQCPSLQLPHPRAHLRDFVLKPWQQLAAEGK